jgi:predicted ATPase/DNA-binding CsgD family transcriptional regulator
VGEDEVVGAVRGGSAVGWLTPLIGRETELADVRRLLEASRLVTLTGAGGVGKTRLALELITGSGAAGVVEAVFVGLGPLEPSGGEEAVADAIRAAIGEGSAAPPGAPLEAVTDHFAARRALLVLDNCEHLEAVPRMTEVLLRRCPGLRVLATSRLALDLPGETLYRLPPLSVPTADALDAVLESEAARLFLQRARRSLPGFALTAQSAPVVAEVCRRLDGLALAIELSAARVRVLSPRQILDGLSDRFGLLTSSPAGTLSRHRSLQASLDWTYQLLSPEAQTVLGLLAVASDWSLEAIEAVAAPADGLLDRLSNLVDAGLLTIDDHRETRRYRLPSTVRSYALERLRAAGDEQAARRAHLAYFRTVAASADHLLQSDAGRHVLDVEAQNLRDALQFSIDQEPALALELAGGLRHWLLLAEDAAEALGLCVAVLEGAPESDPATHAHVLQTGALLAIFQEDYGRARAYAQRAAPLAEASGDPGAIGVALLLTAIAQRSSDPGASAELGQRAVRMLRASGDRHALALAVAQMAMTEALRDRFDAVRAACEEFASLTKGRSPSWLAVWLEIALAWADLAQGDPRSGLAHADRGLELEGRRRSLGYYMALWHKLHALALLGEAERARGIALAAIEEASRSSLGVAVSGLEHGLGLAELGLGALDAVRARALGRAGDPHFAAAANAHELLARVDLAERHPVPLARHAAALRAIGQRTGSDRLRATASWADGAAAALNGQPEEARNRLHEALALQIEHQLRPDALDTVETLAELQLATGRAEAAARLLGAADRARTELQLRRLPPDEARLARLHASGIELIGGESWTAALQEGRRLSFEDALAYARRGHGPRAGSADGLASLTPTELKVVRAAGEGLTNAAIAAHLLMSHGTVKAHLAHAYLKLGVESRLELAMLVRDERA